MRQRRDNTDVKEALSKTVAWELEAHAYCDAVQPAGTGAHHRALSTLSTAISEKISSPNGPGACSHISATRVPGLHAARHMVAAKTLFACSAVNMSGTGERMHADHAQNRGARILFCGKTVLPGHTRVCSRQNNHAGQVQPLANLSGLGRWLRRTQAHARGSKHLQS